MLSHLQTAIHRRDVFTRPSWRSADPRANLLSDVEWEATRPIVCRTLGLPPDPQPILDSLAVELDKTYREVARRLPDNPDVRFEKVKGKEELILTPLDALDEPPSLIQLPRSWPSVYRAWSWRSWYWRWPCGPASRKRLRI